MANEYVNKVEANNQTLIDLTSDTATADDVLEGRTLHLASGAPATGTYRPSDEIEARLEATVGHSSKNLLDLTKNMAATNVTNIVVDSKTGSVSANASGSWKSVYFLDENIQFENGKTYVISCTNNTVNASGSLAIRKRTTHVIYKNTSFNTLGVKSITFTPNTTDLPNGWMISLFITNASGAASSIDISDLMMREVSIADDTFEPYQTPTDEAKIDKPVELVSTATKTFTYPSVSDLKSKYSMLFVTFANSSRSNFAGVWIPTSTIKDNINEQSNYNFASTGFMDRSVPVSIWDDGVHISSTESDETIISIQAFPK